MAITFFDEWIKYASYKFSQHKEKGLYICPAADETTQYNPFENKVEILFSILNIGMSVHNNTDTNEQALDFVNHYGLLGFGQAVIEHEYENCDIKMHNGNPFNLSVIKYTALTDLILPFEKKSHRVIKGQEARATILWSMYYSHYKPNGCVICCCDYCEQPVWIERYAKYLYGTLLKLFEGENFEHRLWNIKTFISNDKKQSYKFDSLKSAIDIMFMELLKSDAPEIKLCKRCRRPFIVKSKKAEFCSSSCRNVFNVKNSRHRKKKKE